MKGLLLKDWYSIGKLCRPFFLIDIIFLGVAVFADGNPFFLMFPCITAGLLGMTLLSYEEHDGWNKYVGTLPYTRAQIVSSKYVLTLLNVLMVGAFVSAVQAYTMLRLGAFLLEHYFSTVMIFLSAGLAAPAVLYPFLYRFGVTKGRIVYYVIIGIFCGLSTSLPKIGVKFPAELTGVFIASCMAIVAVLLYAVSWMLSIRFCKKHEL